MYKYLRMKGLIKTNKQTNKTTGLLDGSVVKHLILAHGW